MRPIYDESEDKRSDLARSHLPPMRPCSSATQSARHVSFTNRHQKQTKTRTRIEKERHYLENTYDDSSVETMTSASLYSLHNHKPKKVVPSFTDYIFCQASFHHLVEEVKGTWEDAASAVDQIVHAFVISDEDLELVSEQIQLAEKEIDVIVQAVRDIGVKRF
jgi:hypothetical protein